MKEVDYYTGFEGEPEMVFSLMDSKGTPLHVVRCWIGYFDQIMQEIVPGPSGEWEGMSLHYAMITGWRERSLWVCDCADLYLEQLKRIRPDKLEKDAVRVLASLIGLLQDFAETFGAVLVVSEE